MKRPALSEIHYIKYDIVFTILLILLHKTVTATPFWVWQLRAPKVTAASVAPRAKDLYVRVLEKPLKLPKIVFRFFPKLMVSDCQFTGNRIRVLTFCDVQLLGRLRLPERIMMIVHGQEAPPKKTHFRYNKVDVWMEL